MCSVFLLPVTCWKKWSVLPEIVFTTRLSDIVAGTDGAHLEMHAPGDARVVREQRLLDAGGLAAEPCGEFDSGVSTATFTGRVVERAAAGCDAALDVPAP